MQASLTCCPVQSTSAHTARIGSYWLCLGLGMRRERVAPLDFSSWGWRTSKDEGAETASAVQAASPAVLASVIPSFSLLTVVGCDWFWYCYVRRHKDSLTVAQREGMEDKNMIILLPRVATAVMVVVNAVGSQEGTLWRDDSCPLASSTLQNTSEL